MTQRPLKHEIDAMSVIELIDKMIWDTSNTDLYRKRLIYLMAQAKSNSVRPLLSDDLEIEEAQTSSPPDFPALIAGRKANGGWTPLVRAIRATTWDRKDYRTQGSTMYKSPDEVDAFLGDSLSNDFSYETMTEQQRRLADTITHAFTSWIRKQPTIPF